ncbi:MAG: hypothetical protein K0S97_1875 [Chloroflexota bacterium]|nr:hypothetical protein [Chloroflexota bacterium]
MERKYWGAIIDSQWEHGAAKSVTFGGPTLSHRVPPRAFVPAVLAILLLAGCSATPPAALPVAAVAPTPLIIYVTPAPVIDEATPEPTSDATAAPTPKPTAKPTAVPTAAPISYKELSDRNWKKLVKAPDNFVGRTYQIWACIWQFDAATGEDAFLGHASYKKQEYWNLYGENASFTGVADRLSDFVEDDAVLMNVISTGSYSYDTQAGGNTTVPSFEIVKITRKGSCA